MEYIIIIPKITWPVTISDNTHDHEEDQWYPPSVDKMFWGEYLNCYLDCNGVNDFIFHLYQIWNTLHIHWQTMMEMILWFNKSFEESTYVLSSHLSYHCPEYASVFQVSHNMQKSLPSYPRWNLHAPEALCAVYHSLTIVCSGCCYFVHSKYMGCAIFFQIWTSGYRLIRFHCIIILNIQGCAMYLICWAISFGASLSSVWMGGMLLYTVKYGTSAVCVSITVIFCTYLGPGDNSHSIC